MSSFLSPIANVVSRVGGGGGGTAASRGGDNTSPSGSVAENQESSTQVPSRVGVLMVKGLFNRWRRLTVELRDNVLVISVMKNGILKRSYKLTAQTTCEDSSVRHFCFCLTNPEQDKLFLAADNIASKEAWMDTIQSALSLIRLSERKLREKDRKKVHVNEVSQYISRPIIYVKIIRARNLKAKDSNGSSDPYVKITLGSSSVRTITRKKDLNPDWGMVFPFDWDLSMRYINIEVWDEDFSSSDDFLGCVFIPTFPLKDGDVFHQWYPLGKRTHRSAVSGEIEIEIACTGQPDNEYVPWQFLQEVQKLPEFSLNLAACQSGSGQVAIRDGPYGSLLTKSAEVANDESFVRSRSNSGRGSPMTLPLPTTSATSSKKSDPIISPELDLIGFPFLYPSIEFEYLEDISLNVSVVSLLNTGKISAPGVLLLTNFRLIFVSLNRILAHDEPIDENPTASSLNAWLNVGNNMSTWGGEETYHKTFDDIDLSTEVPLNTVTNIHLTTESEGTFPNVVNYEAIKMRCSDGRTITFVFKEDSTFFNGLVLNVLSSKYVHKALEHIFRVSDVAALKRRVTNDLSLLVDEATLRETLGTFSISAGMHHSVSGAGLMGLDAQASEKLKKLNIDRLENITSLEFCWLKLVKGNQATLYESVDSVEGPPSHRIFGRLKHKVINNSFQNILWYVYNNLCFHSL